MQRPLGITLLAVLAGIGAVLAIIHTLQMLHLLPFNILGELRFWNLSFVGALVWGLLAVVYVWLVRVLWNVEPQGWLFLVVLSTLNLILALITLLAGSSLQALVPTLIVNGLILIYCLLPSTKEAFGAETP